MPRVVCGFVNDFVDAQIFMKVNAGNAISIPFGRNIGIGFEMNLESIFKTIFQTEAKSGYPKDRKEIQCDQRKKLNYVAKLNVNDLYYILDKMDKDFLYHIVKNQYFEENFFSNCKDDNIGSLLKDLIDL